MRVKFREGGNLKVSELLNSLPEKNHRTGGCIFIAVVTLFLIGTA
jgi:hypothetical protein|tara:strand:- start:584 stop:718 length:135 start_codon:yes stop_codon:yes gene_type:complete